MESQLSNRTVGLTQDDISDCGSSLPQDDSSSVASSANGSKKCGVCGNPESFTESFVECSACHTRRDHAICLKIDLRYLPKDWKCKRCLRTAIKTAPRPDSPSNLPTIPASQIHRVCKQPECAKLVFQTDSSLCYVHNIGERHKKAAATVAVRPAATSSVPRPKNIKKKNLYNFKLPEELKHLKRKRSIGEKNNIKHSEPPARFASNSRVVTPHDRPSSAGMNATTPTEFIPLRAPQQRTAQTDTLAGKESQNHPVEAVANSLFGSINADLFRTSQSSRTTGQATLMSDRETPPLLSSAVDVSSNPLESPTKNPSSNGNHNRVDSPSSQIQQGIRSTANKSSSEVSGFAEGVSQQLASLVASRASTSREETGNVPPSTSTSLSQTSSVNLRAEKRYKYKHLEAYPTPFGEDDEAWNKLFSAANSRLYCQHGKDAAKLKLFRASGETYKLALQMLRDKQTGKSTHKMSLPANISLATPAVSNVNTDNEETERYKHTFPEASPIPPGQDNESWNIVFNTANSRLLKKHGQKLSEAQKDRLSGATYKLALQMLQEQRKDKPVPRATLPSTNLSKSVTTINDNLGIFEKDNDTSAAEFLVSDIPESLEAKRKEMAASFDSSELDMFLLIQAEPESVMQPTPQELVKTQIWGNINPAIIWPKDLSEEWLAAKRLEIDSRGGRKANYGKLLTAQVRKERYEMGWHIHQNKEVGSTQKWDESALHLEELFGIKNFDDLVPCQQNGQLGMMEPQLDELQRKKKKPKVYQVL